MNESLLKDFKKWNTATQEKILKLFPDEKEEQQNGLEITQLFKSGLAASDPEKFKEKHDELIEKNEKLREKLDKSQFMRAVELLENVEQQYIKKTPDGVQLAFITLDPAGNITHQDEAEHINPLYNDTINSRYKKIVQTAAKDGDKKSVFASRFRYYVFDPGAPIVTVREQAVIYYYFLHQDENPAAIRKLSVNQMQELIQVFVALDNYYYNASENNTKDIDITEEFYNFIQDPKSGNALNQAPDISHTINILQSLTPKNYKIPNNKLMNALQNSQIINDPTDLIVSNKGDITAYVFATYNDEETGIKLINNNLTQYQTDVSNAVITIWKQAQEENKPPVFNIDMVYKYMPGGGERPSEKASKEIKKSLDILSNLKIELDATEEMQKRGKISPGDKFTIKENYFNFRIAKHKIKNGGQEVEAYQILNTPLIWNYAEMTNQILTIPRKYLTITKVKNGKITNEVIQMGETRQSITSCILKRIEIMKRDRKNKTKTQSDTIRLDYIYKTAGIEEQTKVERKRNNDFILSVMEYQTAAGNIKGYEKVMNGKQFAALKIIL